MTYNAKSFSKVMRDLARVPSKASKRVARDISKEIQRNFDRGVDPFGRKWRALAPSTVAHGRHPPPLTDTSKGRNSILVKPMGGAGIVITIGVLYMLYHQFGGKRGRPPKRSFLPSDKLPRGWGEIILGHIEEIAKATVQNG